MEMKDDGIMGDDRVSRDKQIRMRSESEDSEERGKKGRNTRSIRNVRLGQLAVGLWTARTFL